jgi:hypothetical protein
VKVEVEAYVGDQIPGEEERDDKDDFVSYLVYIAEKAKEEGMVQLPLMREGVDEEKAMRLAMKASPEQPPLPHVPPRYVTTVMPMRRP